MADLSKRKITELRKLAKDSFGGDLRLAAAAEVQGAAVVQRCGNQVVDWFDLPAIDAIEKQIAFKTKTKK